MHVPPSPTKDRAHYLDNQYMEIEEELRSKYHKFMEEAADTHDKDRDTFKDEYKHDSPQFFKNPGTFRGLSRLARGLTFGVYDEISGAQCVQASLDFAHPLIFVRIFSPDSRRS